MFSKALFKQSCKANGIMWITITIAVCIMLACLMMISGGGNLGEMRTGITNTMVQDTMDKQIQSRALNYYNITENTLEKINSYDLSNPMNYLLLQNDLQNYIDEICQSNNYQEGTDEYNEVLALVYGTITYDFNLDGENEIDIGLDYTYLTKPIDMKDEVYMREYASSFLSSNMVSEQNVDKVLSQLSQYSIDEEDYKNLTYTNEQGQKVSRYTGESGKVYIKDLSTDSIVTYLARLEYELESLDPSDPSFTEQENAIKNALIAEVGESFLSSLPQSVGESLQELGTMDLFNLITGSIFFKVAGLLLPIIYIIMVANNLIAGQVDSGSMAYILSTSTKRKQVVYTQATYLVGSLFLMCLCTTAVSFLCFMFLDTSMITMTYGELALLNIGFFITLFAISGISFLTSCWFNRTKHSMGIGGGLNMFFLVATILGLFGSKVLPSVVRIDSLNFFNYCSIITLFDEMSILGGTTTFIWKLAILVVVGIVCYVIGAEKFKRKDLPL